MKIMFKTVAFTEQLNTQGCVILLGGFDGLHVGHRLLLSRALAYGLPVGVMTIVGGKGEGLFTVAEREKIFRSAGIDFAFELPFDEIKEIAAEEFVRLLEQQFQPKVFVCGDDFRFGKAATGDAQSLARMAKTSVEVVPLLVRGGEKVSSSTVKRLLEMGDVVGANELLGEPFFLKGKVVAGRKVGRTIGFPTANIEYPKEKFALAPGVYPTMLELDGKRYSGITNFGAQPTFLNGQVCVETYIDGFQGDLYGQELTVCFVKKLREIVKFDSVDGLIEQLHKDLQSLS